MKDLCIDSHKDAEYPVFAEIEKQDGKARTVQEKYLIGADGAHSVVRKTLGTKMIGDSIDDVYGVVDIVCDTDFPDIRKVVNIDDGAGRMLIIPREKLNSGDWLTRFYVPFLHAASAEVGVKSVETRG